MSEVLTHQLPHGHGLLRNRARKQAGFRKHDDERRRYYRLTSFGRRVAKAEAARLTQMLDLARSAGLIPKRG